MTKFYTTQSEANAHLLAGQTLGFTPGSGYYAKGTPTGAPLSSGLGSDSAQTTNPPKAQTSDPWAVGYTGTALVPTPAQLAPLPGPTASGGAGGGGGDAAAPAGGGGGSGGGGSALPAVDWAALLGEYGLPADVIAELDRIFRSTGDINQAIPIAQAYVRGTSWYATTYPGIQSGINAGLFGDEQGYRAYKNQLDTVFQQYYGRGATDGELSGYLSRGATITRAAAEFQAAATKANFSDPLKALFTDDELSALAEEQAGIDSALGQKISGQANLYSQINPLYQNFYGRAVTRDELTQLLASGSDAKQIAQQFAVTENINAMNPAIRDLFTPDEIKQIAIDQAGGVTENGKQLGDLANLAVGLNPVYHQYTGAGVSRQEIEDAYTKGLTPDYVGRQFAGAAYVDANKGDIQLTSGAFGGGQLDDSQLKAFGEENAGIDTPMGQQLTAAYSKAQKRLDKVFQGVLALPQLSLAGGKLSAGGAAPKPDVAA